MSAHDFHLNIEFDVSTYVTKNRSTSEFEILFWALDKYRKEAMQLAERNRHHADHEGSEYWVQRQVVETINEMTTELATALCAADQQRMDNPESNQTT